MPENPASYRVVRTKSYLFNKAAVCLDFCGDKPIRRWSEEQKAAARRRNLAKRVYRTAPLFADELIERELEARPDYFSGKTVR
ncbi:hypothetical protein [Raoultella ornithinolytica]|uniref:hypothetical protein n=1 Tax=Raoultella ornithinolytica TaxID=54291 RepID=UPI000FEB9B4B|nr:hypothetical protein [Raoultella ornithinolytica]RWT91188.1 hypothetical protein DN602_29240 [Raoultella ornithinolytica]